MCNIGCKTVKIFTICNFWNYIIVRGIIGGYII
nr:MAG TPA: hypothetical protein [Crassvirales sp.]